VLVIHGDADLLVPLSVGETLAQRASDAELVVVEGGSHMLPVTRPKLLGTRIAAFAAAR
jgi:pimeloyl-ACP methyl ester carboxylesterase